MEIDSPKEVQKELRLLKQLYFVLFFVIGLVGPFASIFLKKVVILEGTDGVPDIKKIRMITSMVPLVAFVGSLLVGILTDKYRLGRYSVTLLALLSIVPAFLVGYAGDPFLGGLFKSGNVVLLVVGYLLFCLFSRPVNTLLDSETVSFLGKHGDKGEYGKVRIWGTWGWAFITIFIGFVLTKAPYFKEVPYYSLIFYGSALSFLLMAILSTQGVSQPDLKPIRIPWKVLVKDRSFFVFLLFLFIGGVVDSAVNMQYMGYFLDEVIDSPLKIGLIFGCWTAFELPVMHYSSQIIRYLGVKKLMVLGVLLTIVKLYLFSLFTIETPYYLKFMAALIHGPAFACYFLAYIDLVDAHSPKEMKVTYMSIATIVRSTFAGFFGAHFGGFIIEKSSSPSSLMSIGSLVLVGQLAFFLLFVRVRREKVKKD